MAPKKLAIAPARSAGPLYQEIRAVLEEARSAAYRAVNTAMVQAYWDVGRLIVEHEQGGRRRAAYGEAVLEELSRRLTADFGRGFTVTNLGYMRQYYLAFPIPHALRGESGRTTTKSALRAESTIHHSARGESPAIRPELSWTHYRLLLRVAESAAREWYMDEAASQHWSTRQLDRQISTLYYERLLASRRKAPVRKEARDKLAAVEPEQFIRDPYVLDFLDLKDYPTLRESRVEQAIIDNLQAFLLELGKGFSFVARQKRLRFEDEDFYVDLVFYNYPLKCFVLIDLKVGALTHQDIGQMDSYVRVFDGHARPEGDNPTIGLVLCSKKNEAIARYSVLNEGKRLFAAKYVKVLPSEAELKREVERERRLIEGRRSGPEGR
jgi:predicted nuclease of restriction endonuclease-like (RecB) superfamily